MFAISIWQSTNKVGSVIAAHCVGTIYHETIPDDIDEIVVDMGGDFYEVEEEYDNAD